MATSVLRVHPTNGNVPDVSPLPQLSPANSPRGTVQNRPVGLLEAVFNLGLPRDDSSSKSRLSLSHTLSLSLGPSAHPHTTIEDCAIELIL